MEQVKYMKFIFVIFLVLATYYWLIFMYEYNSKRSHLTQRAKARKNYKKLNQKPEKLTLDDIFISVKTSKRFEATRLPIILKTWYQVAKRQTWFFTDTTSVVLHAETEGHMVATKCSPRHDRHGLNCKMEVEFNYYMRSKKKWFCHFDDDNYVNVFRLVSILRNYDSNLYWYLGKKSEKKQKFTLDNSYVISNNNGTKKTRLLISFATGGAGFCISQALASKMFPQVGFGRFRRLCRLVSAADDVCVGLLVQYVTLENPVRLTEVQEFHSHLESMKNLSVRKLRNQISFSYKNSNVLNIPKFTTVPDPTKFLSLHCILYPYFDYCRDSVNKTTSMFSTTVRDDTGFTNLQTFSYVKQKSELDYKLYKHNKR